jgi:hypothetical protein
MIINNIRSLTKRYMKMSLSHILHNHVPVPIDTFELGFFIEGQNVRHGLGGKTTLIRPPHSSSHTANR